MTPYKEIESEIISICRKHPKCWRAPATDCPFWPVCGSFQDEAYHDPHERTEAFEAAIAARYNELKGSPLFFE